MIHPDSALKPTGLVETLVDVAKEVIGAAAQVNPKPVVYALERDFMCLRDITVKKRARAASKPRVVEFPSVPTSKLPQL